MYKLIITHGGKLFSGIVGTTGILSYYSNFSDNRLKEIAVANLKQLEQQAEIIKKQAEGSIKKDEIIATYQANEETGSKIVNRLFNTNKKLVNLNQQMNSDTLTEAQIAEAKQKFSELAVEQTSNTGDLTKFLLEMYQKSSSKLNADLSDIITKTQEYMSNLSLVEQHAFVHLTFCFFILFCLSSILTALFADTILTKWNLEKKFPRIARFIILRRKLYKYTLILNFALIFVVLFSLIYVNLFTLIHNN